MAEIKDINECPDCASAEIVRKADTEQVICKDCGLIFEPFLTPAEKPAAPKKKKAAKAKKGKKKKR